MNEKLLEEKRYIDYFASVEETLENAVKHMLGDTVEEVDLIAMELQADDSNAIILELDGEAEIMLNLEDNTIYFIYNFDSVKKMVKVINILEGHGYDTVYD